MKIYKLIVLLILFVLLSGCGNRNNESDAWGNFEAIEVIVSAQAQGELVQFHSDEGDTLDKDEVIGLIDTTALSIQKQQLAAQLNASAANIIAQEKRIEAQEKAVGNLLKQQSRLQKMNQEEAVADQELDNINTQVSVSQKNLIAAKQQKQSLEFQKKALQAQRTQLEDRINRCVIKNPIKGTVLEKYIEEHELVLPGKPLYKIADLQKLILRVYISGAQLPQVAIGGEVTVVVDKDKNHNQFFPGLITWIASEAEFTPKMIQTKEERVSQVYAVKIRVRNDGTLKIGMPGEVRFYRD